MVGATPTVVVVIRRRRPAHLIQRGVATLGAELLRHDARGSETAVTTENVVAQSFHQHSMRRDDVQSHVQEDVLHGEIGRQTRHRDALNCETVLWDCLETTVSTSLDEFERFRRNLSTSTGEKSEAVL